MNRSRLIAEVELLGENVLIVFIPEQTALLAAKDLHDLAVQKNAFIQVTHEDESQIF